MKLSDEIRNYQVCSPLPPELIKASREYKALAILKYSFPERFANLCKAEAPDLQDCKSYLGIEVTSAISPCDEQITGESIKYSHAKTEAERKECLGIIKNVVEQEMIFRQAILFLLLTMTKSKLLMSSRKR